MSSSANASADEFEGLRAAVLANACALPAVFIHASVPSTLDEGHRLAAEGAAAGTLVVAEEQTRGRGQRGRSWISERGAGLWLTLVERPTDAAAVEVLALRVGLALAGALDTFAGESVRLKWPNDLYLPAGKLGGILIEARWRGNAVDWVAIGVGINVRAPSIAHAAGLCPGVSRLDVLTTVMPPLREAASRVGHLTDADVRAWDARDLAQGQRISSPAEGIVEGISRQGELRVRRPNHDIAHFRTGSLTFSTPTACS